MAQPMEMLSMAMRNNLERGASDARQTKLTNPAFHSPNLVGIEIFAHDSQVAINRFESLSLLL